jgi:hypothetical protein
MLHPEGLTEDGSLVDAAAPLHRAIHFLQADYVGPERPERGGGPL